MAPFVLEYKDGQRSMRQARKSPPLVMKTGDVQVREIGPLDWTYCADGLPPDWQDEDREYLFAIWRGGTEDVRAGKFVRDAGKCGMFEVGDNVAAWLVGEGDGEVYAWAPVPDPPPMR